MSENWSAYAVIGCEVTGKLFRQVNRPGCSHIQLPAPSPFCSLCGKPSTRIETIPISGFDSDADKIVGSCFSVVHTTDDRRQFVGFVSRVSDEVSAYRCSLPNSTEIKKALRNTLEPLGLWTEESFGLWTVLHCSY